MSAHFTDTKIENKTEIDERVRRCGEVLRRAMDEYQAGVITAAELDAAHVALQKAKADAAKVVREEHRTLAHV